MNCKQGDLAIITRSVAGNNGKVLTCLRLATTEDLEKTGHREKVKKIPIWVTDAPIKTRYGNFCFAPDSILTPLRGDLSNDEVDTETPIIRETEKC